MLSLFQTLPILDNLLLKIPASSEEWIVHNFRALIKGNGTVPALIRVRIFHNSELCFYYKAAHKSFMCAPAVSFAEFLIPRFMYFMHEHCIVVEGK
jgi:hypothetical protein